MTRLFREGRTETVRSCTTESCAFVRAMNSNNTVPCQNYYVKTIEEGVNSISADMAQ